MKISDQQRKFLNIIFRKMIDEQKTDYTYKDELIRNYIHLIIHEALKMQPSENFDYHKNAASLLRMYFLNYWKNSFRLKPGPSAWIENCTGLRKAVNGSCQSSNRSIKEVIGKSTTTHINHHTLLKSSPMIQF